MEEKDHDKVFLLLILINKYFCFLNYGDPSLKVSLLEILSYATIMFATGMQLPVACNYLWFFMQLQWIFAPFLGVYALWCNYDHLHPNLWMISVIYHHIYLICMYSQLHVQPKQANYGLLVSQIHIFCRHVQDQGCLQMTIPLIRCKIQVKNNLIYFATYLSRASQRNPKPRRWKS